MPARTRSTPICLIVLATVSCAPARTTQAQFEAANLSASNGRFREAIIEYRRVLQAEPRHAQARLKLAELYDRLEDLPSAYHEYVRAADLLPDDLPLQLKTGRFLLLDGRFEEAGARARRAGA